MKKTTNTWRMLLALGIVSALCTTAVAQDDDWKVSVSGAVQSDVLIPQEDQSIGTGTYDEWALTNTYAELRLRAGNHIEAGTRLEYTQYPLPGFENDFKGWGIPYLYVTGRVKGNEITAGSFYDQFGSGLIFRTYEERSLGIDNHLFGGRFVTHAIKGVQLKAVAGKQRRYWDYDKQIGKSYLCHPGWNQGCVWGADAEIYLQDLVGKMQENGWNVTVGGSFVSKNEDDDCDVQRVTVDPVTLDITSQSLVVPQNVGAYDLRANLQKGNYSFLVEWAQKGHDPSFDNGYTYRKGNALLASASYSQRGMSFLLQAKRSEDMSWRSRRGMTGTSSFVNHMPAFSQQHTYALAALYPYATQMQLGEWAIQGETSYTFKKGGFFGWRTATTFKVNFSHIRALNKTNLLSGTDAYGTSGYELKNWGMGKGADNRYYQDVNVTMEKKWNKVIKTTFLYMNQVYNKEVVEGHGGSIRSNIGIAELKWKINKKLALRTELQYMRSRQMLGAKWEQDWGRDWYYGLVEVSWLPYLMFTLSDQYNASVLDTSDGECKHQHYFMGIVTYTKGAHRLQVGYGKTRAGYNCSGGVCRYVPASKGCTISYNYSF